MGLLAANNKKKTVDQLWDKYGLVEVVPNKDGSMDPDFRYFAKVRIKPRFRD